MRKNNKKQNIIQLLLAIAIIVIVNYIAGYLYFRIDLTTDKRYTLSEQSKKVITSINDIVYIEIYLDGEMPIAFQRMRRSLAELMDEFRIIAGDNIKYTFINPSNSTDQSKRNAIYQELFDRGLNPTNVKDRDREGGVAEKILFPGAIVSYQGKEIPLNLLINNPGFSADVNLNNSIQTLEYNFIDAIRKLSTTQRKRIAFIEGQGELDEFQTGDITRELSGYYDIDRVTIKEFVNILEPYEAVIIAGPTELYTEKSKFIVDQYLMNGGKIIWFIDAVKVDKDSLSSGSITFALYNNANIDDQLFKYGVRVNPNVIQDLQCAIIPVNTAVAGTQPKFTPAPWIYYPLINAQGNHPVTRNLNLIKTEFPSVIDTVGQNPKIKKEIILSSSQNARILDVPVLISLDQVKDNIDPYAFNQSFQPIAVILDGEFESVFKNRIINEYIAGQEFNYLEKSVPTKMIVVSDADIIRNDVTTRVDGVFLSPLGYDRYTKQTYGNKDLVMNMVHYLVDKDGIINLRSREIKLRLLDKSVILNQRLKWQLINTIIPLLLIIIFAFVWNYLRRKKYS
ncbi:MAG: gliding motility-associated ABC transporter substrate-binding protein GldG [Bacteroidetes bacterium GWF2_33_16]|nr:MAG: gliding motility-associated ABC transporter substrate-binding protein GldG [Bacteroidetes bacterium GWE2_32_14]OFY06471.1 MAG: gliding motility-associated ABC transporter substrate-binding protein GldG [Bacteroidetes bacterium GWF2_33_16]